MLPTLSSCVLCVVRDTGRLKYGLSCKQTFSFIFLTKNSFCIHVYRNKSCLQKNYINEKFVSHFTFVL